MPRWRGTTGGALVRSPPATLPRSYAVSSLYGASRPPSLGSLVDAWAIGAGLSTIGAAPTRQRLDPLDLFARLLIEGGVAEVDVPVQTRVRVILFFGRWVRVGCARLLCGHGGFSLGPGPGRMLAAAGPFFVNSYIVS